MSRELTVCPNLPDHEYSAEFLLSEMKTYRVDHVVISHVCYYGRDNSYPSDCVKNIRAGSPRSGCWWDTASTRPAIVKTHRGWSA
jgi:hypothetical protein